MTKTIAQPVYHMKLLGIDTAAYRYRRPFLPKHLLNLFIFSQFLQGSQ